jgi:hypothetical protein
MAHLTQQERVDFNFETETRTETYQGSFDELNSLIDGIAMGGPAEGSGVYTGAVLSRREANRGTLEVTMKILNGYSWWGFSFQEISKPVKTWLATKITNTDTLAAELAKIDLWENQKNMGGAGLSNYLNLRYDGTHQLTGFTRSLAEKMLQGVESYSIYTPVATCRRTQNTPFTDGLDSIGKYSTSLTSPTPQVPGNEGQLAAIAAMRPYWLKTSDDITQNSDGTLSRTETWTGYDKIDTDLYERG